MAPALLTTPIYSPSIYTTSPTSAYSSESLSPAYPRTAASPSLMSPAYLDYSSSASSIGSGSMTPTQLSAAPAPSASLAMFAQRKLQKKQSNSSLRVSPTLPDISESPNSPKFVAPRLLRDNSGGRPLSILSEVSNSSTGSSGDSDATIEAYQFRFVNGDETESVFEGSVFEGFDEEEDVRKAEKAFAGVKQKLHAFESSISRARQSIINTPPTSNSSSPIPDSINSYGVRKISPPRVRKGLQNSGTRLRAVSESAATRPAHARQDSALTARTGSSADVYADAQSYRSPSAMDSSRSSSRAGSNQQVVQLQHQMNDLRGKITQLAEKTRRESLQRRSMTNIRGVTPLTNSFQPKDQVFGNPDALTSTSSFHTAASEEDKMSDEGSRAGTPKPIVPPLRKSMSYEELGYDTAFSLPGEEPLKIVSNPRRNRVRAYRSNSSSGSSTRSGVTTPLTLSHQLPQPRIPYARKDSASSVASFETAQEDDDEIIATPLSHRPYHRKTPSKTSPLRPIIDQDLYENTVTSSSSPNDDGYHSGPATPHEVDQRDANESSSRKSLPLTRESLQQVQSTLVVPRFSAAKSATNSIIGAEDDELALKLPSEDRMLVENLCDQLGKVCCRMEIAGNTQERMEIRQRMEIALMVLQGVTQI